MIETLQANKKAVQKLHESCTHTRSSLMTMRMGCRPWTASAACTLSNSSSDSSSLPPENIDPRFLMESERTDFLRDGKRPWWCRGALADAKALVLMIETRTSTQLVESFMRAGKCVGVMMVRSSSDVQGLHKYIDGVNMRENIRDCIARATAMVREPRCLPVR